MYIFTPCRRRRTAIHSAPQCQAVVYNHIGVEGAGLLPLEMVYLPSLLHSSVDGKNIKNVLSKSSRRSGRRNRAKKRLPRHSCLPVGKYVEIGDQKAWKSEFNFVI